MAVRAVELIECGQSGRAVGVRGGDLIDMNVIEALNYKKEFDTQLYNIAQKISK